MPDPTTTFRALVRTVITGWDDLASFVKARVGDEDRELYAALNELTRIYVAAPQHVFEQMLNTPITEDYGPVKPPTGTQVRLCGDRFMPPDQWRAEYLHTCDVPVDADGKHDGMHGGPSAVIDGGQPMRAMWGQTAGLKYHPNEPLVTKTSELRDRLARAADLLVHKQGIIDELAARLEDQHRRVEALRQGVAWYNGANHGTKLNPEVLADVAARFERYLLDGTPVGTPLPTTQERQPMMQPEPVQATDTETPPPARTSATTFAQQQRDTHRDSADMERIRAWWANNSPEVLVGQYDGDAVAATLAALDASLNP